MTNKTLPLLDAGATIESGDLFLTRQGSDTVDKKVTADQVKEFASNGSANKTLSNLESPTVINQSLIPEDGVPQLGTSSLPWSGLYVANISYDGSLNIDVSNRTLKGSDDKIKLDWENAVLVDFSGISAVEWKNRFLLNSAADASIDWESRILYDSWKYDQGTEDSILGLDASKNIFSISLNGLTLNSGTLSVDPKTQQLTVTFDGGGDELIDNSNVFTRMSYTGTITAVTLLCDVVGDLSIDVQKDTFANFPPDGTDSIGTVSITGVNKLYDNTLSGWSDVNFSAGDVLRFNIDSCTDITHAVLVLTIQY